MPSSLFTQNAAYSELSSMDGVTAAGAYKYPNPFCDIASMYIPVNLQEALEWGEYLALTITPFKSVIRRVCSYFLTSFELEDASDDVREKYEGLLNDDLHIMQRLLDVGEDLFVYGNSFVSLYLPFDRYLKCPNCGMEYHIDTIGYAFDRHTGDFVCDCKKCGAENEIFKRIDRRSFDTSRVRVIRWNPKRIRLRVHDISGDIEYYYRMEQRFVDHICDGDRFYLNQTPWSMVQTCLRNGSEPDQHLFKFSRESVFHMKESSLAGLPIKGWAMPPLLPYFKLAYYIQLMRRYDEAIALDFIVPFRVLYPENSAPNGQDALTTVSMSTFISAMQQMVQRKRYNVTDIQVAPFSIGYQLIGGEAKQLAPKDSIQEAMSELLSAMGIPQELFSGNLTLQAAPVALRLFERQFNVFVDGINSLLQWILDRVSTYFMWDQVSGSLSSVTLADDLERKGLQLQAAGGMDISKQTAYRAYGIDFMKEQKRMLDEQTQINEMNQKAQQEAQAAMQQGGGSGGEESGMEGPGGTVGATPGDVNEQADQLAQQLLFATPPTQVRGALAQIKASNPTLYALVKAKMQEYRQQAASQGQQMVMDQQRQQMMGGG